MGVVSILNKIGENRLKWYGMINVIMQLNRKIESCQKNTEN